ncbi:MAG: hypothetical protein P1P80_02985 [ANME-2 cluster archaeon]|nr:hypothetical protein [ANME-2 cluster archaeon]
MVLRKNIALEKHHLTMLEPLLEKNDDNFSAAVRDAIEFANKALTQFETLEEATKHLGNKQLELSPLEKTIKSGNNVVVSYPTLLWFLKYTRGILIDREILDEILDPLHINGISDLDQKINTICQDFGWQVKVSLFSMDYLNPKSVTLMVKEGTESLREFVSLIIAQFFARNMNLDVEIIHKRATSVRIDFKRNEPGARFEGLEKYFGYDHEVLNEFLKKPTFWRTLVTIHMATNYNIISMCRDNFENVLGNKPIQNVNTIESFVMKHISDIPYQEFIETIKLLHENMGIVEKIEYSGTDSIKIYHDYKDEDAIGPLTDFYIYILEANGQHFTAKYSTSLIILERIKEKA